MPQIPHKREQASKRLQRARQLPKHCPVTYVRTRRLVSLLVALIALALPAQGWAADPDAPPGAPPEWLPNEPWVGNHWLPYKEGRLLRILGIDRATLGGAQGINDDVTLCDVSRRHGKNPDKVLRKLVRPWRGEVSPAQYRELRQRARRTFTQPHLAVHMFFHYHHDNRFQESLLGLLGLSDWQAFGTQRATGASLASIGKRNGKSLRSIKRGGLAAERGGQLEGVQSKQTPASQARAWERVQRATIDSFLTYGS
jgi:hypothetical protein